MHYYLPNGSLDLSLAQEYEKTLVSFNTRYDFVDNFMGFSLDFLYDLSPFGLGLSLSDMVDFKEKFSGNEYLQRSQSVTPYAEFLLSPTTKLHSGLRFENTYTDSIATMLRIDQGRNIVGDLGILESTIREDDPLPKGRSISLTYSNSLHNLGSDYRYMRLELNYHQFFYPFDGHFVEFGFQAGYPIETESRPLTAAYYAGGYRSLRGYPFKEFSGDGIIYTNTTYNVPLRTTEEDSEKGISFSLLTWEFFIETAKLGARDIFSSIGENKVSIGTGIGYKINVFNRFPVQIDLSVAKSFEDRPPMFYCTISSLYYTWRN
jgi:hypothetical protein